MSHLPLPRGGVQSFKWVLRGVVFKLAGFKVGGFMVGGFVFGGRFRFGQHFGGTRTCPSVSLLHACQNTRFSFRNYFDEEIVFRLL